MLNDAVVTQEPSTEPAFLRWNWKHVLLATLMLLVGLLMHLASLWVSVPKSGDEFFRAVVAQISAALFIGGLWTALNEFVLKRDFLAILSAYGSGISTTAAELTTRVEAGTERIEAQVRETGDRLSKQIMWAKQEESAGLSEVRSTSHDYDFSDLILHSRKLIVVSNDSQTWTSTHAHALRQRFSNPDFQTIFVLQNPGAPALTSLGHKYGISAEALKKKIAATVDLIGELKEPHSKVEVHGHLLITTYAAYVGDSYAIMRPYFNSQGRRNPPLFRLTDSKLHTDCLFRQISSDCEALLSSSVCLLK